MAQSEPEHVAGLHSGSGDSARHTGCRQGIWRSLSVTSRMARRTLRARFASRAGGAAREAIRSGCRTDRAIRLVRLFGNPGRLPDAQSVQRHAWHRPFSLVDPAAEQLPADRSGCTGRHGERHITATRSRNNRSRSLFRRQDPESRASQDRDKTESGGSRIPSRGPQSGLRAMNDLRGRPSR